MIKFDNCESCNTTKEVNTVTMYDRITDAYLGIRDICEECIIDIERDYELIDFEEKL